jgi:hypothetical protein
MSEAASRNGRLTYNRGLSDTNQDFTASIYAREKI